MTKTPTVTRHASLVTKPLIGLLGGTFDPIHFGHLRLAEEMAGVLGLESVLIMPTGTPPHRDPPRASAPDRLAMTRLAVADNPLFSVDEHEIRKTTPCYMVETLVELRTEVGTATPIVLFLGADAFAGLERWHDWRRLFDLCHIAIAERPGYDLDLPEQLAHEYAHRLTPRPEDLKTTPAGRLFRHAISQLEISASTIRELIAAGHSPRYLLPDAVLDYIEHHRLYR